MPEEEGEKCLVEAGGIKRKKGQDRNPAPFLNPISYEKPKYIRQSTCRTGVWEMRLKKISYSYDI
jgi:hypothetical protein